MNFCTAMVYVGFFTLIDFAVWLTSSAIPLCALLLIPLIPSVHYSDNKGKKDDN